MHDLPEPGTRRDLFEAIAAAPRPVSVTELAGRFGLHHTAVRRHLDRLLAGGLLTEERLPASGRGRPPVAYAIHPDVLDERSQGEAYKELAAMLVDALAAGRTSREAGQVYGSRQVTKRSDALSVIEATARTLGFRPTTVPGEDGRVEVELHRCPYWDLASQEPGTVCSLHLGIAEGIAARGKGVEVVGLEPQLHGEGPCRLRLVRRRG